MRHERVTNRLQILVAVLIAPVFPITMYWAHGEVTEPVLVSATAPLTIWSIAGLFFVVDRRWLAESSDD